MTGSPSSLSALAKQTDPRYRWYVERFGRRAGEVDALDANVLRERLAAVIQEYIDPEAWERQQLVEEVEVETIRTVASMMM